MYRIPYTDARTSPAANRTAAAYIQILWEIG